MKAARQGHVYRYRLMRVMALESGARVLVAEIDKSRVWQLGKQYIASACDLAPLPMNYFHGETAT